VTNVLPVVSSTVAQCTFENVLCGPSESISSTDAKYTSRLEEGEGKNVAESFLKRTIMRQQSYIKITHRTVELN
jgi:hypothetical protein